MSYATNAKFLETQGDVCPNLDCHASDMEQPGTLSFGDIWIDGGYAIQKVSCGECGAEWHVYYELAFYELINEGGNDEADLP